MSKRRWELVQYDLNEARNQSDAEKFGRVVLVTPDLFCDWIADHGIDDYVFVVRYTDDPNRVVWIAYQIGKFKWERDQLTHMKIAFGAMQILGDFSKQLEKLKSA